MQFLEAGAIRTPTEMAFDERLDAIYSSVITLSEKFSPDVAVVEEIYFSRNVKTAISVGQARGVILVSLNHARDTIDKELEIEELNPTTAKKTLTGSGSADKKMMQRIVKQELGLSDVPKPNDAADALALALSYCIRERFQSSVEDQ